MYCLLLVASPYLIDCRPHKSGDLAYLIQSPIAKVWNGAKLHDT